VSSLRLFNETGRQMRTTKFQTGTTHIQQERLIDHRAKLRKLQFSKLTVLSILWGRAGDGQSYDMTTWARP
jgi:hypothetical protein